MSKTAVIALGGNAFTREGQSGSAKEQETNALAMAHTVAAVRANGWNIVLVHGNGPQIGNLAIQQEEGAALVPPQPLFVLDAMTQGEIGSLISLAMCSVAPDVRMAALVTHVVVSPDDPAFAKPTKPIGPFFRRDQAARLASERGWDIVEDAGRGFRRVVASPRPVRVVETAAIRALSSSGIVAVAGGGGGVPVVPDDGGLRGVDAVIDKDYVAETLATELSAEALILVTGVPYVMLDFGRPNQRALHEVDLPDLETYQREGHFPAGSMGPKVHAATQFLRAGGEVAVITTPDLASVTLGDASGSEEPRDGSALGTRIVVSHRNEQVRP